MIPNHRQLARYSSPAPKPGRALTQPRNRSLTELFGDFSELNTEKNDRISTQLADIEQVLRVHTTSHLSDAQRTNRRYLLDLLSLYQMMGAYPRDYDRQDAEALAYVDPDGRFCAVGFLVDRTAGREMAMRVCNREVSTSELNAWLETYGIEHSEIALLHPRSFHVHANSQAGYPAPWGMSQAFAGLQAATLSRHGDYLASTFVATTSGIAAVQAPTQQIRETVEQPAKQAHATASVAATDVPSGRREALAAMFEMLRPDTHGSHYLKPNLRAFFIPNQLGEPVIALTFSRSF